jgi:hypothetical protein
MSALASWRAQRAAARREATTDAEETRPSARAPSGDRARRPHRLQHFDRGHRAARRIASPRAPEAVASSARRPTGSRARRPRPSCAASAASARAREGARRRAGGARRLERESARRAARRTDDPRPAAYVRRMRRLRLAGWRAAPRRGGIRHRRQQRVDLERGLAERRKRRCARHRAGRYLVPPPRSRAQLAKLDEQEAQLTRGRAPRALADYETRSARRSARSRRPTEAAPPQQRRSQPTAASCWRRRPAPPAPRPADGEPRAVAERGRVLRGELSRDELRVLAASSPRTWTRRRACRIAQTRFLACSSDLERARGEAEGAAGSVTAPGRNASARLRRRRRPRGVKSL